MKACEITPSVSYLSIFQSTLCMLVNIIANIINVTGDSKLMNSRALKLTNWPDTNMLMRVPSQLGNHKMPFLST